MIGASMVFGFGILYMWLQTSVSYRVYHASLTRHVTSIVIIVRFVLCILAAVFFVIGMITSLFKINITFLSLLSFVSLSLSVIHSLILSVCLSVVIVMVAMFIAGHQRRHKEGGTYNPFIWGCRDAVSITVLHSSVLYCKVL